MLPNFTAERSLNNNHNMKKSINSHLQYIKDSLIVPAFTCGPGGRCRCPNDCSCNYSQENNQCYCTCQ
jgi:hypothetical protein